MRNLSGINFKYTDRLHLVLSEFTLQKFDLSRSTSSKNTDQIKIILIRSQFTDYVQHQERGLNKWNQGKVIEYLNMRVMLFWGDGHSLIKIK